NYMGRNHGKILHVSPGKIDLVELVPDGQGGWVERPRTMTLKSE
ncbi:MAG: pilus assembly protein PilP, partial [Gammaproteobacteria bacterium]